MDHQACLTTGKRSEQCKTKSGPSRSCHMSSVSASKLLRIAIEIDGITWYNRRLLFWSTKTLLNAFHWAAHIQDGLCLALPLDYFIDLCLHPWGIVEPWGSIVPQGIPNSTIKWSTIMMKIPVRTYFSQLLGFFPSYLDFWKKTRLPVFFKGVCT